MAQANKTQPGKLSFENRRNKRDIAPSLAPLHLVKAMIWPDLVNSMDTACISVFGTPVTFTPQDGSGAQESTGIIQNPAMAEDYVPGSVQGTAVVRLFVRFATITPPPQHGDAITINGIAYDLVEVEADREGGAVLKLRAA